MATNMHDQLPCPNGGFPGFTHLGLQDQINLVTRLGRRNDTVTVVRNMRDHMPSIDDIKAQYSQIRNEYTELDRLFHNGCTLEKKRAIGRRMQEIKEFCGDIESYLGSSLES